MSGCGAVTGKEVLCLIVSSLVASAAALAAFVSPARGISMTSRIARPLSLASCQLPWALPLAAYRLRRERGSPRVAAAP